MDFMAVKYLHILGFMSLFACMVAEHLLLAPRLSRAELNRLVRIDAVLGLSALVTLTAGLLLVFAVGKPGGYYLKNGYFHLKATLFVLAALISLYPTLTLLRARRQAGNDIILPGGLIWALRLELLLVLPLPLLGMVLAYGYG
ncbi:DUF2214 family protein [Gallaecimonas sp. GXIMD4217]|uniref:DUF2214 family protein n=1 Tax=Gallaecimonas sp. GXIMD4217 TaxID=3131927 RepID=UPI00311AC183